MIAQQFGFHDVDEVARLEAVQAAQARVLAAEARWLEMNRLQRQHQQQAIAQAIRQLELAGIDPAALLEWIKDNLKE